MYLYCDNWCSRAGILGTGYGVDRKWRLKGVKSMYEVKTRRCEAQKSGGMEKWRNGDTEIVRDRKVSRASNVTCKQIM